MSSNLELSTQLDYQSSGGGGKIKTFLGTSSKGKLTAHEPICLGSSWRRGTNKMRE